MIFYSSPKKSQMDINLHLLFLNFIHTAMFNRESFGNDLAEIPAFLLHRDSHSKESKWPSEHMCAGQFFDPSQWKDQRLCPVLPVWGRLQTFPHRCLYGLLQLLGCGPAAARHPGRVGAISQGERSTHSLCSVTHCPAAALTMKGNYKKNDWDT